MATAATAHRENMRDAPSYSIDIVNLRKGFRRQTFKRGGYSSVKSAFLNLFRSRAQSAAHYVPVIKDLTLRIPRGASVGIIGRNGAGKSTLLKLMSGIYRPDSGSVSVNGRVAALIELGAGFHPDFTGRENLFLGGVIHGLSRRQVEERFEQIVEFAELADVIDDPVRTYSSGMYMRLAFSLAIHTDPDIFIVDEVLAVGDAAFTRKCNERIEQLRQQGKTLFLVTHDLAAVERWCDEVLWLHEGVVQERGSPRRVIDAYRQFLEGQEEQQLEREQDAPPSPESVQHSGELPHERWGSREIEITSVRMINPEGERRLVFHPDEQVTVEVHYRVHEPQDDVVFGIGITRVDGVVVHGSNTAIEEITVPALKPEGVVRYTIKRLGLLEGRYTLDVAAHREDGYPFDYHQRVLSFVVRWPLKQMGVIVPEHRWEIS